MVSNERVLASRAGPYVTCTAGLRSPESSVPKLHKLIAVLGQKEGYSNVFSVKCDKRTVRKVVVTITMSVVIT